MKTYILFLNIILALLFIFTGTRVNADPVPVFEHTYIRGAGKPVTKSNTFPRINGSATGTIDAEIKMAHILA